uniref:Retrotransposon protein, putative, Ty1-copia subclass n=1 Tax=Tanacetum cinerariifolium TaxID=118510 RepID=A0A6L2JW15_TANCI|nr:retrotransposon protein, putative, Ty1-copia subclass [Tanacetum cinerariifolium]
MRALLVQQGCAVALEGEDKFPKDTKDEVKKKIMAKAHSMILLSVTNEVLREVVDQMTASELWDKLCEKYQNNSLTNRLYQKQWLYTLRMFESTQNFVDTMLYGRTTISVNDVKDALLSKELKRKVSGDEGSGSGLFAGRGRSQERNNRNERSRSKSRNSRKVKCYRCKEKGHIKRDCPQKRGNSKSESSNSGSATVVQDGSDDGDFGDVLTVCSASTTDTWIMDTSASHHMTFSRDIFASFKEWNRIVKLGDDARNLISLCTLAKNGLKYHGEGEWVKVSKGSCFDEGKTAVWNLFFAGHFSDRNGGGIPGLLGGDVTGKIQLCEACVKGKQRMIKFSTDQHTSKEILKYVHSDLWGPSPTKDEVFRKFKEWKTMVEKRTGKQVKTLRTDNVLEFCNTPFDNFCKKEGIVRHHTVRHTPQQNGVAKRMNQTLMARARSPSTAIGLKTPQEVWSGKYSNYSDLRIFVYPAYAHVNDGKHEPRAVKCIFLGYVTGVKGYRLWCTEGKSPDKFLISRDVTVDESAMLGQSRGCESFAVEPVEEEADNTGTGVEGSIAVRKGKRNVPSPARYAGCVNTYDIDSVAYALASLEKNKTWDHVTLSNGVKPVGCKWVLNRKEGIPGVEPARFKVRLVAKGFSQKEGIDYHEVFSPVVKHKTIRILLAMVGEFNPELEQLDVKSAFVHGNLEEWIYMSQSEGFNNSRREQVSGDSYVYLLLYVDDMLIAAKNMTMINDLKALLKSKFEMKDLGAAKKMLVLLLAAHFKLDQSTIPGIDKEVKYMNDSIFKCNGKSYGASNICLVYDGKGHGDGLVSYVYSDYGGDLVKRRSLTCFIFNLFGCAVSWKSTLKPTVALSTNEVEYMSMTEGIKECIWLHGLVQSLGLKVKKPALFCDTQSALSLAKNLVYHERTKYIDVRLNFIRDVLEEDMFSIQKIATEHNPADMLTKALPTEKKETTKTDTEEPLAVREIPSQGGDVV